MVEQMESLTAEQREFAEKIFTVIENQLNRYSHIHKYAEEAYKAKDDYADGTPCEMCSVWDAISLHKNGWADYETMSELSDNIGYINKSMILKEIERDIADIKRGFLKYGKY